MKTTIAQFCILLCTAHLCSAEQETPISVTAQTTYGSYNGSDERKSLLSESVTAGYATEAFGATVNVRNWKLFRTGALDTLNGIDTNLSLYVREKTATNGYVGTNLALTYLTGNDSNTDQKLVPYGATSYLTPDGGQYFDAGFAYMGYDDTAVQQYTATYGVALFDRAVWSQTRLTHNRLSTEVQGKKSTTAVEERLTWYAAPSLFSLTLSGMAGERVYGYDPDLGLAYSLPDIQKLSAGLTANWQLTPSLSLFGDVSHGTYEKRTINNSYSATYGTVGLTYKF
jgi:hypothetical protein